MGPLRVHQGSSHPERRGEVVQTVRNLAIGLGVQIADQQAVCFSNLLLYDNALWTIYL
jgi:hypothetical protein